MHVLTRTQKLITTSLDAFLGNAEVGQQEEQKYFVFFRHNAIIRIDVKVWARVIHLVVILHYHPCASLAGLAIQFLWKGCND